MAIGEARDQRYPLEESELMSLAALKDYAFRRLGGTSQGADIELDDEDVRNAVSDVLAFYSKHRPLHVNESWVATGDISQHVWKTKHVRGMYDLQMTNWLLSGGETDIECRVLSGGVGGLFPYAAGGFPRMDLRFYELQRQWMKIAQRELGSEPQYHLLEDRSAVWVYSPGQNMRCTAELSIDITNTEDVRRGDVKWFRDYLVCLLKEPLGRARSKYDQIPGATGMIRMDGERLLTEHFISKDKLEEQLVKTRIDLCPSWG